ncbi:MAG: RHS repeat-associated core domain-containing protein [Bacteroidota bacterium]
MTWKYNAYYEGGSGYNSTISVASMVAAVAGAFGGVNGGTEAQQAVYNGFDGALGSVGGTSNSTVPAAYLNYVFFDENLVSYQEGFKQISGAANTHHERVHFDDQTLQASKPGFVYIWVSNNSATNNWVYFDDLKVTLTEHPVIQTDDYYPFGGVFSSYTRTASTAQNFKYNGKELQPETQWYDYGARMYDPWIARWNHIDPAGEEYFSTSSYVYALNTPINAIDPDGKRVFFVAGAGNDQIGWDYVNRWGRAFGRSGISGFTRLNVSHDDPASLRNGSMPLGDMMFSSNFRSSRDYSMADTHNPGMTRTFRRQDDMIDKAISDIETNLADNPLAEGEQLNLAGYSYGSVLQAHAALGLADKGQKIDNLILIGSPISSDSDLFGELSNHDNIGNVIRVDIDEDYFSDPEGMDFIKGIFQNLGIDGAHFDLARPGKEADKKIQEETDNLKKRGVN